MASTSTPDSGTASAAPGPDASVQERADRALAEALERTGARDPRDFYRRRLMELKDRPDGAYEAAVRYYRETLVPEVAAGADPLPAWTEYGRELAELVAKGRTVAVDPSGRAQGYEAPVDPDHLVLHLPEARRAPTLLVGLPVELSPAQRAAYDWLVENRNTLRD